MEFAIRLGKGRIEILIEEIPMITRTVIDKRFCWYVIRALEFNGINRIEIKEGMQYQLDYPTGIILSIITWTYHPEVSLKYIGKMSLEDKEELFRILFEKNFWKKV